MMKHPIALFALASLMFTMILGCSRQDASEQGTKPTADTQSITIVSTTGMITDLVERIAGDRAEVIGLIGAGIDPHLYSATRSDIQTLLSADIVFYNGLLLEGKMSDALVRVAGSGTTVRAVTEEIDESFLLAPEEFEGHHDPHVWMDPSAWSKAAAVIRDTLIEHDPASESVYSDNAAALIAQIAELDEYAQRVLHTVPEEQRILVTAHDAFNYFGQRFGYEVVGIQGISTESEAGVRDIERIVSLLVDKQIRAVFVETTVSERNIRALIAGANAQGHGVVIGGHLFSDAMGPSGTYEGTYVGMIDHNVTTIARALGGEAPSRGMQGMLLEHAPDEDGAP
jgi:manganese/zinc/iron transport system substrate-binding protein